MKIKMAPNSLFAVLLRSPWWVSIGIAVVFAAASRALLPDQYWIFGALGAFPLFVVGVVRAVQQWKAPSEAQTEATLATVRGMAWRDFAAQLEVALTRDGYAVTRLNTGAADFSAIKAGRTTLVAAKRWKAATQGMDALQELHAARQAQDASACMLVALGEVSDNARRFAAAQNLQLVQGAELARLLKT